MAQNGKPILFAQLPLIGNRKETAQPRTAQPFAMIRSHILRRQYIDGMIVLLECRFGHFRDSMSANKHIVHIWTFQALLGSLGHCVKLGGFLFHLFDDVINHRIIAHLVALLAGQIDHT